MTMHLRLPLLGLAVALLTLLTPAARASEAAPDTPALALPLPASALVPASARRLDRPPAVRAGRILSIVGVSALTVGGTLFGFGLWSNTYDFRGDWWEKSAYDRAFEARRRAGTGLTITGSTLMGLGYVLLHIGVPMEGTGLYRAQGLRQPVSWVAISATAAATVLTTFTGLGGTAILLAAAGSAGVGLVALLVQFGINVDRSRRLTRSRKHQLYRRKGKVALSVSPFTSPGFDGGGLALTGRF